MNINIKKLQDLFSSKATVYEELGNEHFPIRGLEMYDKRCDIAAHLHCEVVELWLSVVQNQSLEQVFDELVDILCVWNLGLVLYQKVSDSVIDFNKILTEAEQFITEQNFLNLVPDQRKNWALETGDYSNDKFIQNFDKGIEFFDIKCMFNFGTGNQVDIFSVFHKVINDLWNSIRRQKETMEIYKNLVRIFAVWIFSVRIISKQMKYEISFDNIFEISNQIFTDVAKKKFNINI